MSSKLSTTRSNFLSINAICGLEKLGDIIIPGDGNHPKFSNIGCSHFIDEILDSANPDDIKSLNMLLCILHYCPKALIKILAKITLLSNYMPDFIGTPLRRLNIALRGIPFSLYYSNLSSPFYQGNLVFDVMEYKVNVEPDIEFDNETNNNTEDEDA